MKVMLAMSGGVDSSVAGSLLIEQGHDVVGVTMKLWGGASDTGCCSVSDVDDARRVAQQLDIDHLVFNFGRWSPAVNGPVKRVTINTGQSGTTFWGNSHFTTACTGRSPQIDAARSCADSQIQEKGNPC